MSPEKLAKFGAKTPMQRAAQPEEIAPAYVFLGQRCRLLLHQRHRAGGDGRPDDRGMTRQGWLAAVSSGLVPIRGHVKMRAEAAPAVVE